MTPPLRFLASVIGLWCVGRAGVLLWPGPAAREAAMTREAIQSGPSVAGPQTPAQPPAVPPHPSEGLGPEHRLLARAAIGAKGATPGLIFHRGTIARAYASPQRDLEQSRSPIASISAEPIAAAAPAPTPQSLPAPAILPGQGRARALTPILSAWLLWRPGEGGSAAFGPGTLGGAQAGVRLTHPIAPERLPGLSLAARVSSPLRRRGGEAALGVEWQPDSRLPVRVLAERRQRISGEGRSAFALLAHGGVSERPLGGGWRLDAYGAAGVVGARRRDLFAEGAATATRELGPLLVGGGAWAGAQPGVARLDVGPTLALPIRAGDVAARVSLDYRLRVAGRAAPGSGPALTIATGF